jgi:hypothetical protein
MNTIIIGQSNNAIPCESAVDIPMHLLDAAAANAVVGMVLQELAPGIAISEK